ncbi:hypothetical protein B0H16DRAFT_1481325 [Mycena metata]|uniref:Uncharacterized protein n=1 Tax=Mycena metata TaxID=1033252 RepID=A0AAD7GZ39_9AGAR|nr:hypothetical protein B0H16DRAFT_1481325 [Mycena metata]
MPADPVARLLIPASYILLACQPNCNREPEESVAKERSKEARYCSRTQFAGMFESESALPHTVAATVQRYYGIGNQRTRTVVIMNALYMGSDGEQREKETSGRAGSGTAAAGAQFHQFRTKIDRWISSTILLPLSDAKWSVAAIFENAAPVLTPGTAEFTCIGFKFIEFSPAAGLNDPVDFRADAVGGPRKKYPYGSDVT